MGTRGRGNENGGLVDDGAVPTRFCATPSPRFGCAWIAMPACFGSTILSLPCLPLPFLFFGALSSWHILYLSNSESGDTLRNLPGSLPGSHRNGNFHCDEGERGCPQTAARMAVSLKAIHHDARWTWSMGWRAFHFSGTRDTGWK